MSDKDFQIPESLKDALRSGLVVPFIGAGVSLAVKKRNEDGEKSEQSLFPSWKGFVEILAQALKGETKFNEADYVLSSVNIKKPKYLEAMQHAREELGARLWYKVFEDNFDKSEDEADEDSLKLPKLIWKLGNNLIVTTNVDRVFQWTCPKLAEYRYLDVQNVEYARLQSEQTPKRPTVWHLHGHIDHKENVIFTFDQYRAFYEERNNEAKLQTLLNFLTDRTFLFIGFSLDDAYIREQLEYVHKIYKGGADSFYILLRQSEIEKANLPGYVTPVPFSDFGKPLEDLIEELSNIANGNSAPPKPPTEPINPKDALKNHFNVPFASKGEAFVGREGLREKIWQSLNQSGRAAIGQAVSIEGFGGLGKTQLAVEFAHAYSDRYENGVFWLTADENLDNQLIRIGEDLRWISQSDTGFNQAELVRNRFRKLSDCLIIFDNVDEEHPIDNYLPERDARPHILVTSREEQDGFYPINLGILNKEEARILLLQIAERSPKLDAEEKALENILQELDGLPLAIELVGGYLKRRGSISFQDYYEFLQNEPLERLEEKFSDKTFTKHNKSIIRTLKISEKLLSETKYLEEILDILAWSGKSTMGYSLLRELVGTQDKLLLKEALGVALELHFIKQEESAERYAIHRLLAKVRRYEKPIEQNQEWHKKIVISLEEWFKAREDEFNSLSEFEDELEHLVEWQNLTLNYLPSKATYLTVLSASPTWQRGVFQEALKLHLQALDLYKKEQINNKELLAIIYNGIGVINNDLGNSQEALKYFDDALNIRQNLQDNKNIDTANTLDNIGISYGYSANFRKALEFQLQALEMRRELFAENQPDIARSLNNLGATYSDLGNPQKALELKQQALEMQRELFGEKHPDVAVSLSNLASTYSDLGNYRKALELNEQALKMRQELFGEKHPDIAQSLSSLGYTYGESGNYRKALELNEQALKMRQELLGEKHPDIAQSLNNLASTYDYLGNYRKAFNLYESALKMSRELSGEKHPKTILTCGNLIRTLSKLGKREQAGRLAGEFLSYVPQNHPDRKFFEEYGAAYRKARKQKKRRGK